MSGSSSEAEAARQSVEKAEHDLVAKLGLRQTKLMSLTADVWKVDFLYKPTGKVDGKPAPGDWYCMRCKEWKKQGASQAESHLVSCHLDEWTELKKKLDEAQVGGGGSSRSTSKQRGLQQTTLHQHQQMKGDALHRGHAYLTGRSCWSFDCLVQCVKPPPCSSFHPSTLPQASASATCAPSASAPLPPLRNS